MRSGIKKIDSIKNMAVFKNFEWEKSFANEGNNAAAFSTIKILYGRNYSGKTTLSRIFRAMETGELSDKFENPSFNVSLADGAHVYATPKARVFNEDFVRDVTTLFTTVTRYEANGSERQLWKGTLCLNLFQGARLFCVLLYSLCARHFRSSCRDVADPERVAYRSGWPEGKKY
ncbi:MAG: hypothetical protein DRR42_13320 [Gammaproteobacteria bacterium]|nr:MAG: hypothetical protein DRR42_13320 [Gammaproteobacteria bacterium]